jgi:uncharacterized Zn ribbon protein
MLDDSDFDDDLESADQEADVDDADNSQEPDVDLLAAGKETFYPDVDRDLEANGYDVYPEDQLTQGTGQNQYVKPGDGIAVKDGNAVILEKKAPVEVAPNVLPSGAALKNDYLQDTRAAVAARVHAGEVGVEVGKHEVFLAQAEYNAYNVHDGICGTKDGRDFSHDNIQVGYSVPGFETRHVDQALQNRGIVDFNKVSGERGTWTYVYDLPSVRPS